MPSSSLGRRHCPRAKAVNSDTVITGPGAERGAPPHIASEAAEAAGAAASAPFSASAAATVSAAALK
jgi:hypothetical protein